MKEEEGKGGLLPVRVISRFVADEVTGREKGGIFIPLIFFLLIFFFLEFRSDLHPNTVLPVLLACCYNRQPISRSRSAIHSSYHSIALSSFYLTQYFLSLSLSSTFFLLCDIFLPSSTKSCCYSRCSEVVTFYSFVLGLGNEREREREREGKGVTRKGREKVRIRRNQSQESVLLFFF